MDETFEQVDFRYKITSTGKSVVIDTLEIIEHMPSECSQQEKMIVLEEKPETKSKGKGITLSPGQKVIRDNQSGISYDILFGAYLLGATEVKLTDPYIRLPYQFRNFMEFAKLLTEKKDPEVEVKLQLVTSSSEDYLENARNAFEQMISSLESIGVILTYEFNETAHDRSIDMNNGWKIVLGRGLDIWQKTGGWFDINEYVQEKRLCKACEVSFIKNVSVQTVEIVTGLPKVGFE